MTDQRITLVEITNKNTSAFDRLNEVYYEYELPTENYNEALVMALNRLHTHKKIYGKSSRAIIGKMKQDELDIDSMWLYRVFIKK